MAGHCKRRGGLCAPKTLKTAFAFVRGVVEHATGKQLPKVSPGGSWCPESGPSSRRTRSGPCGCGERYLPRRSGALAPVLAADLGDSGARWEDIRRTRILSGCRAPLCSRGQQVPAEGAEQELHVHPQCSGDDPRTAGGHQTGPKAGGAGPGDHPEQPTLRR